MAALCLISQPPGQARTGLGISRTLRGKASTDRLTVAGSFKPLAFNLLCAAIVALSVLRF